MTIKRGLCFVLVWMSLFSVGFSLEAEREDTIAIIYDAANKFGVFQDIPNIYKLALSSNNVKIDLIKSSEYEDGLLQNYGGLIVLSIRTSAVNELILEDLNDYNGKIVYVGLTFHKGLMKAEDFDLAFVKESNSQTVLIKRDSDGLPNNRTMKYMEKNSIYNYKASNTDAIKVWVSSGGYPSPYIVELGQSLIVLSNSTVGIQFYTVLDEMKTFLNFQENESKMLFRLDDVNPLSNQDELKKMGDYLSENKIPFIIGLTPSYVDRDKKKQSMISDVEGFTETIQYLQELGGGVVLNGYSHGYMDEDAVTNSFEFWDIENDQAIGSDEDVAAYVNERIYRGLRECLDHGIYPMAMEIPNNGASQYTYEVLSQIFSSLVGAIQTSDGGFALTKFPYNIHESYLFEHVFSDNVKVYNDEFEFDLRSFVEELDDLDSLLYKDYGVNFEVYLGFDKFKACVDVLNLRGYDFLDLKHTSGWVKIRDIEINYEKGELISTYVPLDDGFSTRFDKGFVNITNVLIVILVNVIILFMIVLFFQKHR